MDNNTNQKLQTHEQQQQQQPSLTSSYPYYYQQQQQQPYSSSSPPHKTQSSQDKQQQQQQQNSSSHSKSHSSYSSHSHSNNPSPSSSYHSPSNPPYTKHDFSSHRNTQYHRNNSFDASPLREKHPKGANAEAKPPQLDFLILLLKPLRPILIEKKILEKIENEVGDVKMEFDSSLVIPEYNGCLLKIKGASLKKKRDATKQLLEFIVGNDLDLPPENNAKKSELITIVIMIPNGLVSMVIGTRGKQISNLNKESKASIVINQPIYKMKHRTVSISGKPANVSNAIMNIQKIMEDRYNEVAKVEFECRPLNVTIAETNVKLIFNLDITERLTYKKNNFSDYLQEDFNISIKTYQDRKNRQLDRKDWIYSIRGTIEHVQNAIIKLTRKVKNNIRTMFDGKESYTMKMLINKNFVTKLIGAEGCMIHEIENFSKGASIKILSNKHDEKKSSCHDIPVCIAGSFNSVQDACCIIIELMECFQNGGPVGAIYTYVNIYIFIDT